MSTLVLSATILGALALPPDSGLLLGLDDGRGMSRRPSTLWITSRAGHVSLVRLEYLLLVPRRDGFYSASVKPERAEPPELLPLGLAPRRQQGEDRPAKQSPEEPEDETGCTDESSWWQIEFVNGRVLALSQGWGSSCYGRSNNTLQVRVLRDRAGTAKPYSEGAVAPDVIAEFSEAKYRQAALEQLGRSAGEGRFSSDELDPLSWTIQRGFGRWQARGAYVTGGNIEYRENFDLPGDFKPDYVRNPPLTPGWDVILDSVPDALDAFAAPTPSSLLVVLTGEHVVAYLPVDGRLGKPALRWPLNNPNRSSAVMVEWATGRNVSRWDTVVREEADRLKRDAGAKRGKSKRAR